ncbi:MAG: VWA domain-containing protein [Bacteroidota bacterium]
MSSLITRKTNLPEHLVQFCRFLRAQGFNCGASAEADVLLALAGYMPQSFASFEVLLRGVLVKNEDQFLRSAQLFRQYWTELQKAEDGKVIEKTVSQPQRRQNAPSIQELKDWLYNGRQTEEEEELAVFSAAEVFTQKDFSAFSDQEVQEMLAILRKFARLLANRQVRRSVRAKRPGRLDLANTLRRNARRGGELTTFHWQKPKLARQRVTVFCDVSKSMDLYTRFLLQFLYGFHRVSARMETFVFGTSLTRISPALQHLEFSASLRQLAELVPDWSGGTNIGKSLATFRADYGQQYLGRNTALLVLSDGWDQGDGSELDAQLYYLKDRCKKLIWINPLAGRPGYRPETVAMKTALPYIDWLGSAHNVASLIDLVAELGKA